MPNIEDCRQYEKEMEEAFNNDVPAASYAGWCLGVHYSPPNLPTQEHIDECAEKEVMRFKETSRGKDYIKGVISFESSQEPIEDLVAKDLKDRARWGVQKYGHALHESLDDMIQHLYEELLDAASYIKAHQVKQKNK